MKTNKLYNVIFPIWMLLLVPTTWIIALPANYIWDTIILIVAMYIAKVDNKTEIYKSAIIKVWLFGFLADLIGATLVSIPTFFDTGIDAFNSMGWNPYENIWSVLILIVGAIICAFMIYLFNKKYSFNKTGLDHIRKNKLAKVLAICTLPYFFLVPTKYLYNYMNKAESGYVYVQEAEQSEDINKKILEEDNTF